MTAMPAPQFDQDVTGFVRMHEPTNRRQRRARRHGSADNVIPLHARQTDGIDLEGEFSAFADEMAEWAELSQGTLGDDIW